MLAELPLDLRCWWVPHLTLSSPEAGGFNWHFDIPFDQPIFCYASKQVSSYLWTHEMLFSLLGMCHPDIRHVRGTVSTNLFRCLWVLSELGIEWYWYWVGIESRLMLSRKTRARIQATRHLCVCLMCFVFCRKSQRWRRRGSCGLYPLFSWIRLAVLFCVLIQSQFVVRESLSNLLFWFRGSRCLLTTVQQGFEEHCTEISMGAARSKKKLITTQLDELGGLFHASSGLGSWLGDEGHIDLTRLWLWDNRASTRTKNLVGGLCEDKGKTCSTDWRTSMQPWWNLRAHWTLSWCDLPGLHEIHGKPIFKGRID